MEGSSQQPIYLNDLASRIKTYTILKWCGMPYVMNPRKCAKHGFINTEANSIKCVGCNISITLKTHLNFSQNEGDAKRMMDRIKKAHTSDCIFNIVNKETLKNVNFPQSEYSMKMFDPSKFSILQRKIVYIKWQEILVSLLKTLQDVEFYPQLDQNILHTLKSYFEDDFKRLIDILKDLSYEILGANSGTTNRDDAYPVVALVALCGWRAVDQVSDNGQQQYHLECPACFRSVSTSILEQQYLPIQIIKESQHSSEMPDVNDIINKDKFEFDPLESHFKHCYYSPHYSPNKENAIIIMGQMLLAKHKQDPQLLKLKDLIQSSQGMSIVLSFEQRAENKLQGLSKIIQDQIIEKLREKQEVQQILREGNSNKEQLLGKRMREQGENYSNIAEEVKKGMEENRKRLKYYEEQTNKIRAIVKTGLNDSRFDELMEEYKQKMADVEHLVVIKEQEDEEVEDDEEMPLEEKEEEEELGDEGQVEGKIEQEEELKVDVIEEEQKASEEEHIIEEQVIGLNPIAKENEQVQKQEVIKNEVQEQQADQDLVVEEEEELQEQEAADQQEVLEEAKVSEVEVIREVQEEIIEETDQEQGGIKQEQQELQNDAETENQLQQEGNNEEEYEEGNEGEEDEEEEEEGGEEDFEETQLLAQDDQANDSKPDEQNVNEDEKENQQNEA